MVKSTCFILLAISFFVGLNGCEADKPIVYTQPGFHTRIHRLFIIAKVDQLPPAYAVSLRPDLVYAFHTYGVESQVEYLGVVKVDQALQQSLGRAKYVSIVRPTYILYRSPYSSDVVSMTMLCEIYAAQTMTKVASVEVNVGGESPLNFADTVASEFQKAGLFEPLTVSAPTQPLTQ